MNNGKVKYVSCLMPDCYTSDELRIRGYCERHFRQLFIEKADKERNRHRLEAERLSSVINQYNAEIKQAQRDLGIPDPALFKYCSHAGCSFKSLKVEAVRVHQTYCTISTKRNSIEREMARDRTKSTAQPRAAAKPKHVKQALTEKDLF